MKTDVRSIPESSRRSHGPPDTVMSALGQETRRAQRDGPTPLRFQQYRSLTSKKKYLRISARQTMVTNLPTLEA